MTLNIDYNTQLKLQMQTFDTMTLDELQFKQALQQDPMFVADVYKALGPWLKAKEHSCKVIALVVLSNHPTVQHLPGKLFRILNKENKVQYHTVAQLDETLQPNDDVERQLSYENNNSLLNRWIHDQKSNNDFLLLQTSNATKSWNEFCLSHADKILYLIQPDESPKVLPRNIPEPVLTDAQRELVLVQRASANKPAHTQQWLQHYKVQRHHHIKPHVSSDLERLARDISGKSNAIVLGGGGARSFAHIGVLQAMEALDIPIDRIGGTSMGAIIAAQYADGHTPEELLQLNYDTWVKNKPHRAFTLPITSLLSARKAKRLTYEVFEDRHIEDLWLDFFCVSSDLTHLKSHVHEQGLLWSALLASGAIPGVCSSIVADHGALLVDGGLLDNLPVETMQQRHPGKVIAVDVTSNRGLQPNIQNTIPPNGWRALADYLNPFTKGRRYPHLFKLLSHTSTLASKINAEASRKKADLCITPQCYKFPAMDMRNIHKLADQGYEEAMPKLEQWLENNP